MTPIHRSSSISFSGPPIDPKDDDEEKQAQEDALKVVVSMGQQKIMKGLEYQGTLKGVIIAQASLNMIGEQIPKLEEFVAKARRGIALNRFDTTGPENTKDNIVTFLDDANSVLDLFEDLLTACRGFSKMKMAKGGEGSASSTGASAGVKREKVDD